MAKSKLEKSITEAATAFALEVVESVKAATLKELMALQAGGEAPMKPGPKPGRKPGRKPGPKPGRKPGPKPKAEKKAAVAAKRPVKKTSKKRNYPKCAHPDCNKNRFARGKGFCGDHWKQWQAKKIKSAEYYLKAAK